jgi:hypothetical protein
MQPVGVRTQAGLSIRNCSEYRGAHYEVYCIGEVDAAKSCVGLRGEHGARGMEDVFDTVGSPYIKLEGPQAEANIRGGSQSTQTHNMYPDGYVIGPAHPVDFMEASKQLWKVWEGQLNMAFTRLRRAVMQAESVK